MKAKTETLAARLRRLREAAGLTQTALAEQIGRQVQSIIRWEGGQREPSLEDCRRLAAALHVTLTDLAG